MGETELYHFGIKGMKWGVRRKDTSRPGTSQKPKRNIVIQNQNVRTNAGKMEAYQVKLAKRKKKVNGDSAYLKYMNDRERKEYAKGRVEVMGSKGKAIRSETTNLGMKTVSTLLKGVGSTAGMFSAATASAAIAGEALVDSVLLGAVGAIPVAAVSAGVFAGKTIARASRYVKNINEIKNVKRE